MYYNHPLADSDQHMTYFSYTGNLIIATIYGTSHVIGLSEVPLKRRLQSNIDGKELSTGLRMQ